MHKSSADRQSLFIRSDEMAVIYIPVFIKYLSESLHFCSLFWSGVGLNMHVAGTGKMFVNGGLRTM